MRLCSALRLSVPLSAAVIQLSACVAVDDREIAPGVFAIVTPASGFINSESRSRVILGQRALMLCPTGYEKRADRATEDAQGRKSATWEVACK